MKNSIALRSVSAAAVLGLSLGFGAPVVMAQTTTPAASPVITQSTGTLTIHKYANPDNTGDPTGTTADEPTSGTALKGVGFTIYKINDIDMSTNDGIAKAAGKTAANYLTSGGNANTALVTSLGEEITGDNGQIVLADLPIGAYLVVETSPLDGYAPAAPFIAYVPMTSGNAADGGTTWTYDVHAYPKNYNSTAVKKVEDSNKQAGDTVDFTIESDVPALVNANTKLSKYTVTDDLQENLISTTAGQVVVKDSAEYTYIQGTEYTITVDPTTQKVDIVFTSAGLTKLTAQKSANANLKVITTINANVKAPTATGTLVNEATVISNNGAGGGEITTTTNKTYTYWGNVKITKVDASNTATKLAGAEFQVYSPGANGTCEAADKVDTQMITVNGQKTWTTAADGTTSITGIHINDFEDNGAGTTDTQVPVYCLFETKSPAGYELLSKPIPLKLTKTDASATAAVYELASEVKNLKDTTPQLPLTGGTGIGILAAIGAALVGAGAWFARRNSKKA